MRSPDPISCYERPFVKTQCGSCSRRSMHNLTVCCAGYIALHYFPRICLIVFASLKRFLNQSHKDFSRAESVHFVYDLLQRGSCCSLCSFAGSSPSYTTIFVSETYWWPICGPNHRRICETITNPSVVWASKAEQVEFLSVPLCWSKPPWKTHFHIFIFVVDTELSGQV